MEAESASRRLPIQDLVKYFLRLGVLGFGGPVALVGQMERELVDDKKWLTKDEMREGIAVWPSAASWSSFAGMSAIPCLLARQRSSV